MENQKLKKYLNNIINFWDSAWEINSWSKWQRKMLCFFKDFKAEDVSQMRLLIGRKQFAKIAGMFKFDYKEYLSTDYWKELSNATKEKRTNCQLCSSKEKLEVHHNNYKYLFLETDDDLTVLCHKCHSKFHDKEEE